MGTVWESGRLGSFPGLLDASALVREMQAIPCEFDISSSVWHTTEHGLHRCRLSQMQAYPAWCRLRGFDWEHLGPCHVDSVARTKVFAGLSGQRYPSSSSSGLGLDHGLGKDQHMAQPSVLPTPFAPRAWPEPDVSFVVDALFIWRCYLASFTAELSHVLHTVARALAPLESALDEGVHEMTAMSCVLGVGYP